MVIFLEAAYETEFYLGTIKDTNLTQDPDELERLIKNH
jgi:hypothetical protein